MFNFLNTSSYYDEGIKFKTEKKFNEMEQEFIKGAANNEYNAIYELFHYYLRYDTQKAILMCDLAWKNNKMNKQIKSKILYNMCIKIYFEIQKLDDIENDISKIIINNTNNISNINIYEINKDNFYNTNIYEINKNKIQERKYDDLLKIIIPSNIPITYLTHKKWILFNIRIQW